MTRSPDAREKAVPLTAQKSQSNEQDGRPERLTVVSGLFEPGEDCTAEETWKRGAG